MMFNTGDRVEVSNPELLSYGIRGTVIELRVDEQERNVPLVAIRLEKIVHREYSLVETIFWEHDLKLILPYTYEELDVL